MDPITPALKLTFLGTPQLSIGGEVLTGRLSGKPLALFIYLAVTGRPHARDVLADLLWSDLGNQQARNNLRYLLPDLRRVLGDYITITPQSISINHHSPYWLDVEMLRTALTPTDVSTPTLQAALDLYQGEFLAGFSVRNAPNFEAWLITQQEELHTLAVQGLYRLAQRYWQTQEYGAGLTATQRLLTLEPWHEAGHRLQMLLLVHTGQRAAALAQFALCQQTLATEFGVTPVDETVEIYKQIRNGCLPHWTNPADDAPTATTEPLLAPMTQAAPRSTPAIVPAMNHNLPHPLTPFIGRQQEIIGLHAKVLDPHCALVSLVGEGGVGKTRLALAVAYSILDSEAGQTENPKIGVEPSKIENRKFPDGIWFVPLADIPTAEDALDRIVIAIGEALDLSFVGKERLVHQLFNHLRHKKLLLILDNFEHLTTEAELVLEILRTAPGIKIMITSRQWLDLQAEHIWRLDGLTYPELDAARTLTEAELLRYESVALFVERAQRSWRDFQLNAANQHAIISICRLVQGLPLGIELAAAQIRRHTCAEIVDALQTSHAILATTQRDILLRHRSMQTVLDSSWQLLISEDAQVLAACSIFRGGFTLAAAAAVAGATPDHLARLVGHSLICQASNGRFELHELVRHYAAQRLTHWAALEKQTVAHYCTYYTDLLQSMETALANHSYAQKQVRLELENIRFAWALSMEEGRVDLLEQGLESLATFYQLNGLLGEALQTFQTAIACVCQTLLGTPASHHQRLLARMLIKTAEFQRDLGQVIASETLTSEAVDRDHPRINPGSSGMLTALGAPCGGAILPTADWIVQEIGSGIEDESLRQSFLDNVGSIVIES